MVTRPPIAATHFAGTATLVTVTPTAPPPAPAPPDLDDDRLAGAGLSGALPALLLPLRIETRWFVTGTDALELRVRWFPDVIHVAEERADLSSAEVSLARRFIDAADGASRRAVWDEAVNALGAPRATYAVLRVRDGAVAVAAPAEGVNAAHLLPSRVALVLEGRGLRRVAWGRDIASPLPAGIAAPDAEPTRWQFDFDAAESAGLALRVPFDRAAALALTRIFAIGLRDGTPAEQAQALGAQLGRQFAGAGSALLAAGTPTNNTDEVRSGFDSASRADAQAAAIEQIGEALAADADGARLARALGLDETLFRPLTGARDRAESEAAMLHAALWPGTMGTWLAQLMEPAVPADAQAFMRTLFVADVRARGPLPLLRIGRQPYGVLPATSLARWRAADGSSRAAQVLRTLRKHWAAQAQPPTLHQGGDENTLRAVLAQLPVSRRLALRRARPAEAGYAAATLAALERAWTAVEPALRNLGLTQRPVLSRFVHDPAAHWTRLALVAPPGAPRDQPLAGNYLRALATPATATALRSHQAAGGAAPATLLYVLVRAGFLEIALSLVKELFGITSITVRDHRGGRVVTRIERPWRMLTRPHARLDNQTIAAVMALAPNRLQLFSAAVRAPEWVQLTAPVRALRAALAGIAELPVQRLEDGLLEALDAMAHRLDAWVTALATRRLREQRQANPAGLHLGAWGFVGAPPLPPAGVPVQPARSDGFEFAPSLAHARTAALLRSGFEARRGDAPPAGALGDAELAVDLASSRMRGAVELVQMARAGCSVGEALGRRLERWLVDQGLGAHTPALRESAPLAGGRIGIDGVKLADDWQRDAPGAPLAAAAVQLVEWVDALADLMLAEGLHQLAGGRRERARAVIEAIERGEVLPEHFDVLAGPAGGAVRTWRLALAAPTGGGWPGSAASVRAAAAPALEALAAAWLGAPKALKWTVNGQAKNGRAKKLVLDATGVGLCALDLVALARRGNALPALVSAAALTRGLAAVDSVVPAAALDAALLAARMLARLIDTVPPGDAAAALVRTEAAIDALRAATPAAALRRAAWSGAAELAALDERLAAAPPAGDARARLDALAGIRVADAVATVLPDALAVAEALGAPSAHAWLHDIGRLRPAVAAAGALLLARSGALSVHDDVDGTRWVVIAPAKAGAAPMLLDMDRWSEPLPAPRRDAAAALHVDAPRARAPQSLLLAVSPSPEQPWSLSILADVIAETVDMLPLRAAPPAALAGHFLPAAMVADDLDGEAFGTLAGSAFRQVLR